MTHPHNDNINRTLKAKEFRDIFQNSLKVTARSMSVKTILSERNLKRINYRPYYQRNFVWDTTKQTFFIESVIMGTEIPPLILFKSGVKIEVIDGRQRFETLKRFKENSFGLTLKGLKELKILNKQNFNKLSPDNKDIFLNSNIRVFEFEVINHPNIDEQIIDWIKKEIFRRYNTGITPLTREELDNAKYDEDVFSELFRGKLKKDLNFFYSFNQCFFPNENLGEKSNFEGLITKNIDFIRRSRVLISFPITTYAAGSQRSEIIDLLYEFKNDSSDNITGEYETFLKIITKILSLFKQIDKSRNVPFNIKLVFECLFWGLSILEIENIEVDFTPEELFKFATNNSLDFSDESSHYYGNILRRYNSMANFLSEKSNFDFGIYIKNESFRKKINDLKQTEFEAAKSIEDLSNLRLHKPNPISIPVDEVRADLQTNKYLLRPSYQRQEKINEVKASSIIESILLGFYLPPIFIYKHESGLKEVVDGQQRLLAIIGFLGEQFYNEDGKLTFSKNNNFRLKRLKILTDFEGKNFSSLPSAMQDKILDFVIDQIIIEQKSNENFDPVDLFIRLNFKPYPIKSNSFEMWNSIVDSEVIQKIKEVTAMSFRDWFFLRDNEGKPNRMENEEFITILSYLFYNISKNLGKSNDIVEFYPRQDRIIGRLKDKKSLGDFLVGLDSMAIEKSLFLKAIDDTCQLVFAFENLFDKRPDKESLNDFLNVKKTKTFRRSLQDFYVIWMVLSSIPMDKLKHSKSIILSDISSLLSFLKNTSDVEVNEDYVKSFKEALDNNCVKYIF